jgi:hypothetical protein
VSKGYFSCAKLTHWIIQEIKIIITAYEKREMEIYSYLYAHKCRQTHKNHERDDNKINEAGCIGGGNERVSERGNTT